MKKITLLALVFTLFSTLQSCKETDGVEKIVVPVVKLEAKFYQPSPFEYDSEKDYLQASFSTEGRQFSTFGTIDPTGIPGAVKRIVVSDSVSGENSMILLDQNGEPAFMYSVDVALGTRSNSLIEFENSNAFETIVRMYLYDWENRIGILLLESKVRRSGSELIAENTFLNEKSVFTSLRRSTPTIKKKENQSFSRPIHRLDELLKSKVTRGVEAQLSIEDFYNTIENFRNSTVTAIWENGTSAGAILVVLGVAVGGTAISPLVLAGAGVMLASEAVPFFTSDRWTDALQSLRNASEVLENPVSELEDLVVERFEGYNFPTTEHWPAVEVPNINLSRIQETVELFLTTDNESLDDLPDSQGVLQIGISWNTNLTDVDLWVYDPSGELIYFENPNSVSGGYLDRDDVDGFGPENVYWNAPIPDGEYSVIVDYFSCRFGDICTPTNVELKISNGLGDIIERFITLNNSQLQQGPLKFVVENGRILPFQ